MSAMIPHSKGKYTGTSHTDKNSGKRGWDRGGETASEKGPLAENAQEKHRLNAKTTTIP